MTSGFTVVILAFNSEEDLPAALDALDGQESPVLVVDSGSEDNTREVAAGAGAKVLEHEFTDFATQRNWAMRQVDTPYVLFVDSDEVATPELLAEVRTAVHQGVDGAWIPTLDYFAGRWMLHGMMYPQPHLRLLRRDAARFVGSVHERVAFEPETPFVVQLEHPLIHRSHTTLSRYLRKLDAYTEMEAAERHGPPALLLLRGVAEGAVVVVRSLVVRRGWRDGVHGFVGCASYAFYRFTIHAKAALRAAGREPESASAAMARWRARGRP